jgi:hypothetical protein
MVRVVFTPNLERHLECPPATLQLGQLPAGTVREVLAAVFGDHPRLRGYLLDDQGRLRQHVVVFVDGRQPSAEDGLDAAVGEDSEVYVMQALSGG